MNRSTSRLLALALVAALPLAAHAESDVVIDATNGNPTLTAEASLDFQVVVPKVLFLQVGTGTSLTDVATVDLLTFTVPGATLGDGTDVAATGGNGASGVTARLIGNAGNITLASSTLGALANGAGDTISFTQIKSETSNTALPVPALVDGASTSVTVNASNRVVNQTATWSYAYDNSVIPAAGTYGGQDLNNGRVTYTASLP
jgi:hypothetical protein